MAQDPPSFRYRTIIEVAAISLVIYFFLGTPGLSSSRTPSSPLPPSTSNIQDEDVPEAKAKIEALTTPDPNLQCPPHAFKNVHVFSSTPLVVYIDGFLSEEEADHFVDISFVSTGYSSQSATTNADNWLYSAEKWQPSTVFNRGVESSNEKVRKSEKAMIDRDNIVQCIESRALAFQGALSLCRQWPHP